MRKEQREKRPVWAEVDLDTFETIKPEGLDLLGKTFRYKGQTWTVENTDPLFPTERVACRRAGSDSLRSMTAEAVRGLLSDQDKEQGEL